MSTHVIKCLEMVAAGSRSDGLDVFLRDLISSVITLAINGRDQTHPMYPD